MSQFLIGVTSTKLTAKGLDISKGYYHRDLMNLYTLGIKFYHEPDPPLQQGDTFEAKGLLWNGGNIFKCTNDGIIQLNPKKKWNINRKDVKIYDLSLFVYNGTFQKKYIHLLTQ